MARLNINNPMVLKNYITSQILEGKGEIITKNDVMVFVDYTGNQFVVPDEVKLKLEVKKEEIVEEKEEKKEIKEEIKEETKEEIKEDEDDMVKYLDKESGLYKDPETGKTYKKHILKGIITRRNS